MILVIGDGLDAWSYGEMMQGRLMDNIIPLCFAAGSVFTFVNAIVQRRFSFPDAPDIFVIFLDLLITGAWRAQVIVPDATSANLLYQFTTVLAFVPMYRGLASGREKETLWPWIFWTGAYAVFFFIVDLSEVQAEAAVYPLVGLITHALVLGFVLEEGAARRR